MSYYIPAGYNKLVNTLRLRRNGRHFADYTFNRIFVNENVRILIKFSLQFVPKGPITNFPALVQIMAWRRPGDKPLSEPVMVSLLMHICVTQPQWVKGYSYDNIHIDMKFHIQTLLWTFFSELINSLGPYFICLVHVRDFWTMFHGHQFAGQERNWEI